MFFGMPEEMFTQLFNPRTGQAREHVSSRVWSPSVDVYEDGEAIVIKADLPGMSQQEIDIEMNGDVLTIKGERHFEDEARRENYVRIERQYGAFQRSFTIGIPVETDKVTATYRNGILELTIPKAEAVKPKKVQVKTE
jgi:HSP20 family protein